MPVSFQPAKHNANVFPLQSEWVKSPAAAKILEGACHDQFKKCSEIFQSSLSQKMSAAGDDSDEDIIPHRNGFLTRRKMSNSGRRPSKVAYYQGGGSGSTWVAGWINAFCVFGEKGKWTGNPIGKV
jgi:hypothetical protein